MTDDTVRRFIELRDGGAAAAEIGERLGIDAEVAEALVKADEAQALAHRIAAGEEPMYPPADPADRVVDARAGSAWVPIAVLIVVLVGVIVYALVR